MSSPLIWIVLPLVFALIFWSLQSYPKRVFLMGAGLAVGLALLARILPIEEPIQIARFSFKVSETLDVLGRTFTLTPGDMPFVSFVYLVTGLWFIGALANKTNVWFVPLGLGMVVFLMAALAVDPFLYAALLIEIAVLLSIPMMSQPGLKAGYGIQRYLIFQTLAVPFILFTGWMLTGIENNPADEVLAARVIVMLGLGFSFLLAIFPFYTWIPVLVEEAPPYVTGFVFVMLPMAVLMFLLNFLDRYAWLRTDPRIFDGLRLAGVLMVATSGIWAAFQRSLARILGYAVIIETGLALLAISSFSNGGLGLFAAQLLPRAIGLWVWVLALEAFRQQADSSSFKDIRGMLRRYPFIGSAMLTALFSLAGLPLLAGFPIRFSLMQAIGQVVPGAAQSPIGLQFAWLSQPQTAVVWIALGLLGLFIAGFRFLLIMVSPGDQLNWTVGEKSATYIPLCLGMLLLLAIGLFPHWFLPRMLEILSGFIHLVS